MLHALCVVQTVSRIKNSDGVPELQILICFNRPEKGVDTYKRRWEIKTAFRAMKSSGFNIEDTRQGMPIKLFSSWLIGINDFIQK